MKEDKLDCNLFTIKAAIVGASHIITFIDNLTKKTLFTEIVADYEHNYKDNTIFIEKVDFNNRFFLNNEEIIYEINFIPLNIEKNPEDLKLIQKFYEKNKIEKNSINLNYIFDKKDNFNAETILCLNYNKRKKIIETHTLHTYPNENKALITNSKIKFKTNELDELKIMMNDIKRKITSTEVKKSLSNIKNEFGKIINNLKG
jgi:hypothetical protein